NELSVGQPFVAQVIVENYKTCDKPIVPEMADFGAVEHGQRENMSIVNSAMSRQRVFEYEFTPKRAGNLTIPPIEVTVDGTTLRTRTQKVLVGKATTTDLFW